MLLSGRASYWIDADTPLVLAKNGDATLGPLSFLRRKNPDGLAPEIIDAADGSGRAIRLAVKRDFYSSPLDDPKDGVNDRCELREAQKTRLGEEVWYGFSVRVPDAFPRRPLRCVVAQVKMPYDDTGNGSPAFSLRLDSGQWLATVEHLYEPADAREHRFLSASVNGACGIPAAPAYDHHDFSDNENLRDLQVRALLASDSAGIPEHLQRYEFTRCTTGVELATFGRLPEADGRWSDFIVRIASSASKNRDGIIELYADGRPVARARGEFGYLRPKHAPPSQYFKIGPYRNNDLLWGDEVAAIEVRDIRRGPRHKDVDIEQTSRGRAWRRLPELRRTTVTPELQSR